MSWKSNCFHPLHQASEAAMLGAQALLQAYPLTNACLHSLQQTMVETLEFGFFSEESTLMTQGEKGRDLFVLCRGAVDVWVDGQKVIQMQGPVLLGDKALVEPQSKRAATICVSPHQIALVLKIPLDPLIHDFDNPQTVVQSFQQEIDIFCQIYQEIQNRLFDYSHLQKGLSEKVHVTLRQINSQFIAKSLDNQKELGWDQSLWQIIRECVEKTLNLSWPQEVVLNEMTFHSSAKILLEKRYPLEKFVGTAADYLTQKHRIWRKLLITLGERVMQHLPQEHHPFRIQEMDLFNPQNYRLRILQKLREFEQQQHPKGKEKPGNASASQDEAVRFFGKGEQSNQFDFKNYLQSLSVRFQLETNGRIQAQLAQQLAGIAAACENEFNGTLARMQRFLEKAKSRTELEEEALHKKNLPPVDIGIQQLLRIFSTFNRSNHQAFLRPIGKVFYESKTSPTFFTLTKYMATAAIKADCEQSFQTLIKAFKILDGSLSPTFIYRSLHWIDHSKNDQILEATLKENYWMFMEPGGKIATENSFLLDIEPGLIFGGPGSEGSSHALCPNKESILFVLPKEFLPWTQERDVTLELFISEHLPVIQWLLDRSLQHIQQAIQRQIWLYQQIEEWIQLQQIKSRLETFESTTVDLTEAQEQLLQDGLKQNLGMVLPKTEKINSQVLSKQIYEEVMKQTQVLFSQMKPEEQSNKAYTRWRQILEELMRLIEQASDTISESIAEPKPALEVLSLELQQLAASSSIEHWQRCDQISHLIPRILLSSLITEEFEINDKKIFFNQLLQKTNQRLYSLLNELGVYEAQLSELKTKIGTNSYSESAKPLVLAKQFAQSLGIR